jgi:hypothetical protein
MRRGAGRSPTDRTRLVERYADPRLLLPDDVARNSHAICFEGQDKTLGHITGAGYFNRGSRDGHVADQAIDHAASELNGS